MQSGLLDTLPLWTILLLTVGVALLAVESGSFRSRHCPCSWLFTSALPDCRSGSSGLRNAARESTGADRRASLDEVSRGRRYSRR